MNYTSALWPIATALLIFFLQQLYSTRVRANRLRDALLVDCIESLKRLSKKYSGFQCNRPPATSAAEDLLAVRSHMSGFVVAGAAPETRELITLLDKHRSRLVVWYFERWELFKSLEQRYSTTYQKLLESAAKCCDDDSVAARNLREEYWDQMAMLLSEMSSVGRDICRYACRVFRALASFNELELFDSSNERWHDWSEFEAELASYQQPRA
jgi:hypothetical protein